MRNVLIAIIVMLTWIAGASALTRAQIQQINQIAADLESKKNAMVAAALNARATNTDSIFNPGHLQLLDDQAAKMFANPKLANQLLTPLQASQKAMHDLAPAGVAMQAELKLRETETQSLSRELEKHVLDIGRLASDAERDPAQVDVNAAKLRANSCLLIARLEEATNTTNKLSLNVLTITQKKTELEQAIARFKAQIGKSNETKEESDQESRIVQTVNTDVAALVKQISQLTDGIKNVLGTIEQVRNAIDQLQEALKAKC